MPEAPQITTVAQTKEGVSVRDQNGRELFVHRFARLIHHAGDVLLMEVNGVVRKFDHSGHSVIADQKDIPIRARLTAGAVDPSKAPEPGAPILNVEQHPGDVSGRATLGDQTLSVNNGVVTNIAGPAGSIVLAIINHSTALTDEQVLPMIQGLQTQISRDFAPAWGIDAQLEFVPAGADAPDGAWVVSLLDNSDQAGALGYHDDNDPTHAPTALVFVKDDIDSGFSASVTISHELLEMLVDPFCNQTVISAVQGKEFSKEVCDPPEDDAFGYNIDGVMVSDFVLPSYFQDDGVAPFDIEGKITAPFQVLGGGYQGWRPTDPPGAPWQQLTNEEKGPSRHPQRWKRRAAV